MCSNGLSIALPGELGIDPIEIRRKNLIRAEQMPYKTPFLWTYDSGDMPALLASFHEIADLPGFEKRRRASQTKGKFRGLGFAFYMEACGMGPSEMLIEQGCGGGQYEVATIRVSPTGGMTVLTGSAIRTDRGTRPPSRSLSRKKPELIRNISKSSMATRQRYPTGSAPTVHARWLSVEAPSWVRPGRSSPR